MSKMKFNKAKSCGFFVALLCAAASVLFSDGVVAQVLSVKKLKVQPILVKNAAGTASGDISILYTNPGDPVDKPTFEAAAKKIWKQASIELEILPARTVINDAYVNLSSSLGGSGSVQALSVDFTGGGPGSVTQNGNGVTFNEAQNNRTVVYVWFVSTIGGGSSIAGVSMENGPGQTFNGVAIAKSATSQQAIGALGHELGHVLGLSHSTAFGDQNNLMEGSKFIHTSSLANIEPDGLRKYKLTTSQIDTVRRSPFLTAGVLGAGNGGPGLQFPPPSAATGLSVPALLAATDGSLGTQDQIGYFSDILAAAPAGKSVSLHFQAYDFVQGAVVNVRSKAQFAKVTSLIQRTLPRMASGSVLVISTYLDDGLLRRVRPSWTTFRNNLTINKFWALVEANDASLSADWQTRSALPFKQWVDDVLSWAQSSGFGSRLRFEVCPQSDDGTTSSAAYQNIVDWTLAVGLNPSVTVFRSPFQRGAISQFIVGVARVDFHQFLGPGATPDTKFIEERLEAGDSVANEGQPMGVASWKAFQAWMLARGESACFWSSEFGTSLLSAVPPNQRGPLTGLTPDAKLKFIDIITSRGGF